MLWAWGSRVPGPRTNGHSLILLPVKGSPLPSWAAASSLKDEGWSQMGSHLGFLWSCWGVVHWRAPMLSL